MAIGINALLRGELEHPTLAIARDIAKRKTELHPKPEPKAKPALGHRPGTVDANGNILGVEPGLAYERGTLWLSNEKEARKAEAFGWRPIYKTVAGLVRVER
jgi:hypothetical protein